ncbi:phosphoribosyl-AMP cyclohydrolase [candidate division CSSED10-310 bacterium]|uniref:phosphoribosyl-AMP cyclohydrolase n=1 Tax=candidate division CSSED10-310 bacterium TaxID=2855610 RepID=A0ABV6YST2_UNCC1
MKTREITLTELFTKRHDRIPVVTFERSSGRVLGLNCTNREAFNQTVSSGQCHYYDEVNDTIYLKGEHSGEIEDIIDIRLDCCHARRHELHLMYTVQMAVGQCKFGLADCHFYRFVADRFVLDQDLVQNQEAFEEYWPRIITLLETEEDKKHLQRFKNSD